MRMSRAPITRETVDAAMESCGAVHTEIAPLQYRILRTPEELRGERPRDWIERMRARFDLRAPWDHRTLGLERAS